MADDQWFQQALLDIEVLEAHLRIGVVPSADHAQVQWELIDPRDRRVIGMSSAHHTPVAGAHTVAREFLDELLDAVYALIEPF